MVKKDQKQNFLQGALILSLGTVAVKIIGAMFKLPIQNMLGEVGSTHFHVAYQIYSTLFVLATAGLPVAISKMVSESHANKRDNESERIFSVAFSTFMIIGFIGSIVMFFGAGLFAQMMNVEGNAVPAIRAIAPAVFFVSIICPFRGFYQGKGNMIPTAYSQVIEALGKLIFGLLLAWILAKFGFVIEIQAAGAIAGVTIGTLAASAYLFFYKQKNITYYNQTEKVTNKSTIFRKMLSIAIPITISSAILSLTNLIDTSLVLGQLKKLPIFPEKVADHYFGAYSWAITLFNLPASFIITLAVSIIPAIAAARLRKDKREVFNTVSSAFRITALLALPAAAGFISLAQPILQLLYPDKTSDKIIDGFVVPGGIYIAAPLLTTLGFAVLFVSIVSLTNAILQSLNLVNIPLITMVIGAVAKIVCNFVLVGNPDININGAPVGTLVCYGIISILNISVILLALRTKASLMFVFVKPLVAAALMGIISVGVYRFFSTFASNSISIIFAILLGAISYFILIILLKTIPKSDFELLPGGSKIVKILKIK